MTSMKRLGLVFATAFALVLAAPAVAQFGFDPAAEASDDVNKATPEATGAVLTPLNDWWGCGWEGKAD
ncbi:hypothetical protein [Rathayibacter tritici]|uniref:hypothetical protein n=1 Tax=Rathayibacter tritici TaxID=33888 RepID=UPI000ACAE346|nr:hypothetical protein [Rathayibacter tritici]